MEFGSPPVRQESNDMIMNIIKPKVKISLSIVSLIFDFSGSGMTGESLDYIKYPLFILYQYSSSFFEFFLFDLPSGKSFFQDIKCIFRRFKLIFIWNDIEYYQYNSGNYCNPPDPVHTHKVMIIKHGSLSLV